MDVVAVRPDLTMIVEPPGRSYLLRHDGGVLLVDTGVPGLGAATVDVLRDRGLGPDAITHVVLTHRHTDHTPGRRPRSRHRPARRCTPDGRTRR